MICTHSIPNVAHIKPKLLCPNFFPMGSANKRFQNLASNTNGLEAVFFCRCSKPPPQWYTQHLLWPLTTSKFGLGWAKSNWPLGFVFCRSFRHVGIVLRHGSWQNIVIPRQLQHKLDFFNVGEFFFKNEAFYMKIFKNSDLEATRVECLHSIIKDTNWIQAIHKDSMKIVVASTHLVNIFLTCQKAYN
jgi:hypothetical protein